MVAITLVSGVAYAAAFLRSRRPAKPAPAKALRVTA
jgi:hypothetical protein